MTNQQIEKLIARAETQTFSGYFALARVAAGTSLLLTSGVFFSDIGAIVGMFAFVGWLFTWATWRDGQVMARLFRSNRALGTWRGINATGVFGGGALQIRALLNRIEAVYERDPEAKVLPLTQAVRLVLTWQQQQQRLEMMEMRAVEMRELRTTLLQKQTQLRALGDDNAGIEQTLARLESDIGPLERSTEALRASCARLEAIVLSVDAAAQRRQLHREVGKLTAEVRRDGGTTLELSDEHLDLERQIGREIETFLQLERETDAHLREL